MILNNDFTECYLEGKHLRINGNISHFCRILEASPSLRRILAETFTTFLIVAFEFGLIEFVDDEPETKPINKSAQTIDLSWLDLSARAYNCLHKIGVTNVHQLENMSKDDLLKIKNLGTKTVHNIEKHMEELGYHLRGSENRD